MYHPRSADILHLPVVVGSVRREQFECLAAALRMRNYTKQMLLCQNSTSPAETLDTSRRLVLLRTLSRETTSMLKLAYASLYTV